MLQATWDCRYLFEVLILILLGLLDHMAVLFFTFWLSATEYGIFVLWLGIEPAPTALEAWSLNHWTTREVPIFNFFEEPSYYVFHSSCTNLYSHQQCTRVLTSPLPPSTHQLLSLLTAILPRVMWYHTMVLLCISLIMSEAEHFSYGCWYIFF